MRRRDADPGGLDSLLDMMTNVVGILIVLVAVTQLSFGDAMQRIRDRAIDRLRQADASVAQRSLALALAPDLASLENRLATLEPWRSALEREPIAGESDGAALAATRAEADTIAQTIAAEAARLRDLRVSLTGVEIAALSGGKVRLPDPRPPPPGTKPLRVLCRYGRCAVLPERELLARVRTEWLRASGDDVFDVQAGVQRDAVVDHFERGRVSFGGFRLDLRNDPRRGLLFKIGWEHRRVGDSTEAIVAGASNLVARLEALDPSEHYVDFSVWADSFEPYLVARRYAEEAGLKVGWDPLGEDEEYQGTLEPHSFSPTPID